MMKLKLIKKKNKFCIPLNHSSNFLDNTCVYSESFRVKSEKQIPSGGDKSETDKFIISQLLVEEQIIF